MMAIKAIKVYADTSVYGGVFDDLFSEASRLFFEQARAGRFHLVVSPLVRDELMKAPEHIRRFFIELTPIAEVVEITPAATQLRQAYINASIVGPKSMADALHVSLATLSDCRLIVSWNFKHIVHFQKIPLYNAINVANGYGLIGIHTPQEVINHEDH
jgi:hypothetical protein